MSTVTEQQPATPRPRSRVFARIVAVIRFLLTYLGKGLTLLYPRSRLSKKFRRFLLRDLSRTDLRPFRGLRSLDQQAQARLYPSMIHHAVRYNQGIVSIVYLALVYGGTVVLAATIASIASQPGIFLTYQEAMDKIRLLLSLSASEWGVYVLYLVLVLMPVVIGITVVATIRAGYIGSVMTLIMPLLLMDYLFPVVGISIRPEAVAILGINDTGALYVPLALILAAGVVGYSGWYLVRRSTRAQSPESACVIELLAALSMLEGSTHTLRTTAQRRIVLQRLETAARCMQHWYPRALRTGDPATDAWVHQLGAHVAGEIRQLARWVVSPQGQTYADLTNRLAELLQIAISGRWGEITWDPAAPLAPKIPWPRRVLAIVRTILVGVLPLGVYLLVQRTQYAVAGPLADALAIAAVLWILLTLAISIDPAFGSKVSVLKDVGSLFNLPGSGKS